MSHSPEKIKELERHDQELLAAVDSQPNVYGEDGGNFSQPAEKQAETLLSNARRTITVGNESASIMALNDYGILPHKNIRTLKMLRTAVFEVIVARLNANRIASTLLVEEASRWMLPVS